MVDCGVLPTAPAMVRHCSGLFRQRLDDLDTAAGLIVGCGSGDEVVYLRRAFGNDRAVGVDVEMQFSAAARTLGCVVAGDAKHLPFKSHTFHFAAAFHSLEHVGDPRTALDEVQRVLRVGAWFYVGVPNRTRVLGYLGSFDASTWQKITWNLTDWGARLRGKFRNERGAHAGFDREELQHLLTSRFGNVEIITAELLRFKYGGRLPRVVLNALLAPGILDYSAPAHYAICQKLG